MIEFPNPNPYGQYVKLARLDEPSVIELLEALRYILKCPEAFSLTTWAALKMLEIERIRRDLDRQIDYFCKGGEDQWQG